MSGEAARLRAALDTLGISTRQIRARGLRRHREARRLVPVGLGTDGRDKFLLPVAAQAWHSMQGAAHDDGVELLLVSAFRSIEFQAALIRAKLDRGLPLDEVLRINAPPGYSEHHTGCALDLGVAGCAALDEAFEHSAAFAWLQAQANRFGFTLSYPRNNAQGYLYEPWHWCFRR